MSDIFKLKIIILLFSINLFSNDMILKKEIIWLQNQRPPWMINHGKYVNQGYGDKIREYFVDILSQYSHKTIPINSSRFFKEVNKYNNICYGPVTKLKVIEDYFYWSKAIYAISNPSIIVLESTFKKLGSPEKISIEKLLSNKKLVFGKIEKINYYPIDKFRNQKNIVSISTSESTTNLLNMLQKKRVDWIYDFPLLITWHTLLENNFNYEKYKTIEIKETNKNDKIIGYMACSKNSFGKEVILQINQSINKDSILKIRSYVKRWQPDSLSLEAFDKVNQELHKF